jgi:hypothetical protein
LGERGTLELKSCVLPEPVMAQVIKIFGFIVNGIINLPSFQVIFYLKITH